MRLLLTDPRVDPTTEDCEAFLDACVEGYTEVVKILLEDGRCEGLRPGT